MQGGAPPVVKLAKQAPRVIVAPDGPVYLERAELVAGEVPECRVALAVLAHAKAHDGQLLASFLTDRLKAALDGYYDALETDDEPEAPSTATTSPRPTQTQPMAYDPASVIDVDVAPFIDMPGRFVGRSPKATITTPESLGTTSYRHLDIEDRGPEDGDCDLAIRDVSSNGVYVVATGVKLTKGQWYQAKPGTLLSLGGDSKSAIIRLT